jgi:AraC-like DNA-binding protein
MASRRLVRTNAADMTILRAGTSSASAALVRPITPTMLDGRMRKILEMVGSGTAFKIRDLAFECNLSPWHLQRLFKHQTGVSMGEWISEQRMQRAAQLLANSYLSVKEIAYSIGYEHASSFVRAFEQRFAQAPTRYRKQTVGTKC